MATWSHDELDSTVQPKAASHHKSPIPYHGCEPGDHGDSSVRLLSQLARLAVLVEEEVLCIFLWAGKQTLNPNSALKLSSALLRQWKIGSCISERKLYMSA